MLTELNVKNFAIINDIHVSFRSGFNVLSGETGSGKSVLLKSLALLMGEKSNLESIKSGASQAVVEGRFDIAQRPDLIERLESLGIESPEHSLVVKRVLAADGKNRVYINGSLSTLNQLRDIVSPLIELTGHPAPLIEMTGQHENRNLQSKLFHLESLDQYIGAAPARSQIEALFMQLTALKSELSHFKDGMKAKNQRLDFLTYQRDEIKNLNLSPGEEETLESEVRLSKNVAKLTDFLAASESALYSDDDSVLVRLHRVIQKSYDFSLDDKKIAAFADSLHQAKTQIEEAMYGLRDHMQSISSDPQQLEKAESRLSDLRKLQKKYGATASEILEALKKIEDEIAGLENSETKVTELEEKISSLKAKLLLEAKSLHAARVGGSKTLTKSVNAELADLNMKGLLFSIKIEELPEESITSTGLTDVEFMIQTSKKDSLRSLAKFASGGELSRILLSLKRVVGLSEHPRTYLFDEVDAGVSGVTAEKVGRKLKSIAKGQQVISVTHLPQVAAFADVHFVISKTNKNGFAQMAIDELDKAEQIREIARMLSGEKITKTSLDHAKELLGVRG